MPHFARTAVGGHINKECALPHRYEGRLLTLYVRSIRTRHRTMATQGPCKNGLAEYSWADQGLMETSAGAKPVRSKVMLCLLSANKALR